MADLRDRYRRDYRSVPIPTPPRPGGPRGNFTGAPPLPSNAPPPASVQKPAPSQAPSVPATPPTAPMLSPKPKASVRPLTPTAPPAASPPKPSEQPSEPFSGQTQARTKPLTKRQAKAAQKAQKKAEKKATRPQRQAQKKGRALKRWAAVGLILLILAGLGVGGAYGYQHVKSLDIPASYVKTSLFPVLYPVSLPDGYYVDANSFNHQGDAFVFTIRNSSDQNKSIAVSEQVLPNGFNPDKQLPDDDSQAEGQHGTYTTQAGKGQVGSFQGNQVATLATDKTWIIMNVSTIPSGDIGGIASSFEQIKPLPYLSNKRLYLL